MEAVGRIAGVSQVTVSRALSDPSKVSPETLQRIQDAIAVTGFVPNALAGALASRRSKLISALVPSITNIVYSALVQTFSERMRAAGYQILLSETGFSLDEEEALIRTHLSRRPDAMMLTGTRHSAQARRMLLAAEIPVVEVWDVTETPIDLCVGFSHSEAGRAVAEFVADLDHSRAAVVSANDERALRRRDAFCARLTALGQAAPARFDCPGAASIAAGRAALADLLDRQGFAAGVVFCSSDLLAHGVLIEAQARGIDVPGRIAVIGFGDQAFAAALEPALTTVAVDRARLGAVSADALLGQLQQAAQAVRVHDIGFEIRRRASC
ncbi:LacI family DNA-binding transcriptional regulator [Thioclava sp. BHET1]|nr:LacI family DNA-binding transcriptional regulator [Thioclava sp. BHET1]